MNAILNHKSEDELRELVEKLSYDTNYGCFTRPGLELIAWPEIRKRARWIIYGDIDGLHECNDTFGHDEMNRRIREAIQLRKTDVAAAARWYSGDELIWILCDSDDRTPTNPQLAAKRLQAAFRKFGLSVTFGISRVLSYELADNVSPAHQLVARSKSKGRRGSIHQTGSLAGKLLGIGL